MVAGSARTNKFLISEGTVMIGRPSELWDLTPEHHSLGLVKNVQLRTDPEYAVLRGNRRGRWAVASSQSSLNAAITMDVHEFTSRNICYALGLDGRSLQPTGAGYLSLTEIEGTDRFTFHASGDVTDGFPAGSWLMIQNPDEPDQVHYARVSAISQTNGVHSVIIAASPVETGNHFPAGSTVRRVNVIHLSSQEQPFYSMKIIGELANKEPIAILCPKIRITKGFSLLVNPDQYASFPFSVLPLNLLPGDEFYETFRRKGAMMIMSRHSEPSDGTWDSLEALWSSTTLTF